MKKLTFGIVAVLLIAFGISAIVSCEKEDVLPQQEISNIKKSKIYENPFDVYGENIKGFYVELKKILKDSTYIDKDKYNKTVQQLAKKYANSYPKIDTSNFSEKEDIYIQDLIRLYAENNDIRKSSEIVENKIVSNEDLTDTQKNRLLSIISQIKFNCIFQHEILNDLSNFTKESPWEDRFNNCMDKELGKIFANDGNPIPEIEFIQGLPFSFYWLAAECAWDATFG